MKLIFCLFIAFLCTNSTAIYTYTGHWQKTWRAPSTAFRNAQLSFAFSGEVDVRKALSESRKVYHNLRGAKKIITIGGGNRNGYWTKARINEVALYIDNRRFAGYQGIAFDVEEGESGLAPWFRWVFEKAKKARLDVVVTVSHTAPYQVADARDLVLSFINDPNIDIISPMMYSSGQSFKTCDQSGYLDTRYWNVPWSWYARSRAAVVPSIWRRDHYKAARRFLAKKGIRARGYIIWCL